MGSRALSFCISLVKWHRSASCARNIEATYKYWNKKRTSSTATVVTTVKGEDVRIGFGPQQMCDYIVCFYIDGVFNLGK